MHVSFYTFWILLSTTVLTALNIYFCIDQSIAILLLAKGHFASKPFKAFVEV